MDEATARLERNWGNGSATSGLLRLAPKVWRKVWFGHGDGAKVYVDSTGRVYGILASDVGTANIVRALRITDDAEWCVPDTADRPWWWKYGVRVEPVKRKS